MATREAPRGACAPRNIDVRLLNFEAFWHRQIHHILRSSRKLMKSLLPRILVCLIFLFAFRVLGDVHYVSLDSTNPEPPYLTWATAATNIQDAIDASTNGDTVLVTNGVYTTGGKVMPVSGNFTNRVALDSAITVQSVNGPWATVIQGVGPIDTPLAVRCAWLTNNATLTGFTLQMGSTSIGNPGGGVWCASSNALVNNCVIISNTAAELASGCYQGTYNNCLISSNNGYMGATASAAFNAYLNNCTVVSNSLFSMNSSFSKLTNCIVYYNTSTFIPASLASYCCTTPPLASGAGNFTNAPQLFADGIHLLSTSPCIGAGTNIVTGTDIFGQPWANPPSVGCAEYNPAPLFTQPNIILTGNPIGFSINGAAAGAAPLSVFWLLDGVPLQDDAIFTGTQTASLNVSSVSLAEVGDYQLVVSNSFGVITSAVTTLNIHCVDVAATNPIPPYLSWATAATNIQDAINASENGDIVWVTNGLYNYGGESEDGVLTNRVTLNKAIRVQSVNGPWVTTIQGAGATNGPSAIRCGWLTNGAALVGFTLEAGATATTGAQGISQAGGAVWCISSSAVVDNCVISSNTASKSGVVYQGTLNNCLVSSNFASGGTAIVLSAVLSSCTIVSNSTLGVDLGTLTNCIVYYNRTGNLNNPGSVYYCCTTPAATGTGNLANAPDLQSDGVHLAPGSPCIGAGTNIVVGTDIFGVSWANPPSVGCAEYNPAPIVGQPQITLTANGFQIGNITVAGPPPFGFIWLENGAPVSGGNFHGAQSSNLLVTGVNLAETGSYQLVVTNAAGSVTSAAVQLNIHAVNVAGTNPQPPYLTWATAATNIQDAIEASAPGDIVLVTNGVYDSGGEANNGLTNRVTLNRAILVTSVNGFRSTIIQGAFDPISTNGPAAVRCAWLTNNAILSGFTLQNGATLNTGDAGYSQSGGGVWCACSNALVSNCVLSNNFAKFSGGGGIYGGPGISLGTLNNSLVIGNTAYSGGGAYYANLNNCTVQNNYAIGLDDGGGSYGGTIRNSIVVGNTAGFEGVYLNDVVGGFDSSCSYSCADISPGPSSNIVANPVLCDSYHISIYSPCRGAGSALYSTGTDLDGEPWNNPPSMGCDEVVVSNRVGPLSVDADFGQTNLLVSSSAADHIGVFFGTITGLATYFSWDFSDGPAITNAGTTIQHYWTNIGDYTVTFTAYNVDNPSGVSISQIIHVVPITPPDLPVPTIVSNTLEFQFPTQWGGNYYVQYATNLTPPVTWTQLEFDFFSFGTPLQVQDSTTNGARFYRVLVQ